MRTEDKAYRLLTRLSAVLWSPQFLVSLFVLFLNDFLLKELFGSWFTGKLSDFSGLFALALILQALWPHSRTLALTSLGLLYALFKSPFVDDLLAFYNARSFYSIGRVQDWTDLMALLVLPLAYLLEPSKVRVKLPKPGTAVIAGFALFLFCATSYSHYHDYVDRSYYYSVDTGHVVAEIQAMDLAVVRGTEQEIVIYDSSSPCDGCTYQFRIDGELKSVDHENVKSELRVYSISNDRVNTPITSDRLDYLFKDLGGFVRESKHFHLPRERNTGAGLGIMFLLGTVPFALLVFWGTFIGWKEVRRSGKPFSFGMFVLYTLSTFAVLVILILVYQSYSIYD